MTDNLALWNKVRRVPEEHLKGFKRGGGFSGTAIKPMWSIKTMTEQFGPCGTAWGTHMPKFKVVPVDKEVLVYCTLPVWIGKHENVIVGVGGDKVVKYVAANPQYNRPERWENDDEAFKKAYTDALTNALKLLGVGADIHMGLWDGNKYVDEAPEPQRKPEMAAVNGSPNASKSKGNRAEYEAMVKKIRNATSEQSLKDWYKLNVTAIDELPVDYVDELRVEYQDRLHELKKELA